MGLQELFEGVRSEDLDAGVPPMTMRMAIMIWRFPKIKGTFLGDAYNKNYSILGVYIGVPSFWETTISLPSYHGSPESAPQRQLCL